MLLLYLPIKIKESGKWLKGKRNAAFGQNRIHHLLETEKIAVGGIRIEIKKVGGSNSGAGKMRQR